MLTQVDRALLALEEAYPRPTGLKTDRIIHELGLSPARYSQRLFTLVAMPEVIAEYPMLAKRVQRRRDRLLAERQALLRFR